MEESTFHKRAYRFMKRAFIIYSAVNSRTFESVGNKNVKIPRSGNKLQKTIKNFKLYRSASVPRNTAPTAPIPKAKPTINPETKPIFLGTSSCAYTTVTLKLDVTIKPMRKISGIIHSIDTCGNKMVNGAAPAIDINIILRRPKRSANGPPKKST